MIDTSDPDYDLIRATVDEALARAEGEADPRGPEPPAHRTARNRGGRGRQLLPTISARPADRGRTVTACDAGAEHGWSRSSSRGTGASCCSRRWRRSPRQHPPPAAVVVVDNASDRRHRRRWCAAGSTAGRPGRRWPRNTGGAGGFAAGGIAHALDRHDARPGVAAGRRHRAAARRAGRAARARRPRGDGAAGARRWWPAGWCGPTAATTR